MCCRTYRRGCEFPSDALHEIASVECDIQNFKDGRFTVNGWIHSRDGEEKRRAASLRGTRRQHAGQFGHAGQDVVGPFLVQDCGGARAGQHADGR